MTSRTGMALLLLAAIAAAGCSADEPFTLPDEVLEQAKDIVGGNETQGWPQVGMYIIDGGYGGVCTATLVHPEYLLTAAHCAEDASSEDYFFVGYDSEDIGFGDLKGIKEAFVHPAYGTSDYHPHDVAVLQLHGPLSGIDPIPVNQTSLNADWIGRWLHLVGFGSNTAYNGSGAGLKRETDLEIYDYSTLEIMVYTPGTNACTGDSGGPAFVDMDGFLYDAGVISSVYPIQAGHDACEGASLEMRVDAEMNFIDDYFDPDEVDPFETPEWGPGEEEEEEEESDDDVIDFDNLPAPTIDEDEYEGLGGWECSVDSRRGPALAVSLLLLTAAAIFRRRRP